MVIFCDDLFGDNLVVESTEIKENDPGKMDLVSSWCCCCCWFYGVSCWKFRMRSNTSIMEMDWGSIEQIDTLVCVYLYRHNKKKDLQRPQAKVPPPPVSL